MTARWDFDEIMWRAGSRPRHVKALYKECGLEPPTSRAISMWNTRGQIPHTILPTILMMLLDTGRLDNVKQVIKGKRHDLPALRRQARSPHVGGRQGSRTQTG